MYSDTITSTPPKIRFKMESHKKYESFFIRQRNGIDNRFTPSNPPPFTLSQVQEREPFKTNDAYFEKMPACVASSENRVSKEEQVLETLYTSTGQDTHRAALLLTSIRNLIVEDELQDSNQCPSFMLPNISHTEKKMKGKDRKNVRIAKFSQKNKLISSRLPPLSTLQNRIRSVSMDFRSYEKNVSTLHTPRPQILKEGKPVFVSPPTSPSLRPVSFSVTDEPLLKKRKDPDTKKRTRNELIKTSNFSSDKDEPNSLPAHFLKKPKPNTPLSKNSKAKTKVVDSSSITSSNQLLRYSTLSSAKKLVPKAILKKKFSWKNFPELERFLIENREEYLRHSALNYTMQQKQYNNRLTERLIEVATQFGYAFDEEAFTFVTIRDRIRCYFKSYVQSRKKRGVIIGYAARKAGLLAGKEVERNIITKMNTKTPSLTKRRK